MKFCVVGNYVYHKTAVGDFTEAIIRTPWFKSNVNSTHDRFPYCIKFSYHMNGNSNRTFRETSSSEFYTENRDLTAEEREYGGGLRLYAYQKESDVDIGIHQFVFGKLRNQGNTWHTFSRTFNVYYPSEVR